MTTAAPPPRQEPRPERLRIRRCCSPAVALTKMTAARSGHLGEEEALMALNGGGGYGLSLSTEGVFAVALV